MPPLLRVGGGNGMFVPPPHFQTQNLGLGIEPTDICDVTLAWLASRVYYGSSMGPPVRCAPHTFCHVPTPLWSIDKLMVANERRDSTLSVYIIIKRFLK